MTLTSGGRDPVHDISVADPAGATMTPIIFISRSGDTYIYSFNRMLGSLYLVDGLR